MFKEKTKIKISACIAITPGL